MNNRSLILFMAFTFGPLYCIGYVFAHTWYTGSFDCAVKAFVYILSGSYTCSWQ